jgi:hypothetical protein
MVQRAGTSFSAFEECKARHWFHQQERQCEDRPDPVGPGLPPLCSNLSHRLPVFRLRLRGAHAASPGPGSSLRNEEPAT